MIGTRDAHALSERDADTPFGSWRAEHPDPAVADYADAVAGRDLVVNALNGTIAVEVLGACSDQLRGGVLLDVTNPLDFASGTLELFVCNTDSLGEQIQRALPATRVVKTLYTVTADVQVEPSIIGTATDMFAPGCSTTALQ